MDKILKLTHNCWYKLQFNFRGVYMRYTEHGSEVYECGVVGIVMSCSDSN